MKGYTICTRDVEKRRGSFIKRARGGRRDRWPFCERTNISRVCSSNKCMVAVFLNQNARDAYALAIKASFRLRDDVSLSFVKRVLNECRTCRPEKSRVSSRAKSDRVFSRFLARAKIIQTARAFLSDRQITGFLLRDDDEVIAVLEKLRARNRSITNHIPRFIILSSWARRVETKNCFKHKKFVHELDFQLSLIDKFNYFSLFYPRIPFFCAAT